MVSFLVARSDPDEYGKMTDYRLPKGTGIDGPIQVFARINQEPEISRDITLLGQQGSEVIQGNLLVIPIESSVLYVQPIYVQSAREGSRLPQFNRVVVVYGDQVRQGATLDEALRQIFGVSPPSPTSAEPAQRPPETAPAAPSAPGAAVPAEVQRLLEQAEQEFALANDALRRGDLAEYQRRVNAARDLIARAATAGRGAAPAGTTTAVPGASPTAGAGPRPTP